MKEKDKFVRKLLTLLLALSNNGEEDEDYSKDLLNMMNQKENED